MWRRTARGVTEVVFVERVGTGREEFKGRVRREGRRWGCELRERCDERIGRSGVNGLVESGFVDMGRGRRLRGRERERNWSGRFG